MSNYRGDATITSSTRAPLYFRLTAIQKADKAEALADMTAQAEQIAAEWNLEGVSIKVNRIQAVKG